MATKLQDLRKWQFMATVVFVVSIILFQSLGGGTPEQGVADTRKEFFNEELPSAQVEDISEDKLAVIQAEEERRKLAELDGSDNNSFGLLNGIKEQSKGLDINMPVNVPAQEEEKQIDKNVEVEELIRERERIKSQIEKNQKLVGATGTSNGGGSRSFDIDEVRKANKKRAVAAANKAYNVDIESQTVQPKQELKTEPAKKDVAEAVPEKRKTFNTLGASKGVIGHDIRAVVHGTHKNLTNNSQVKLRLLDPMVVDGVTIPRNAFVYGKVSFGGGRVQINIDNVNYQDNVLPFRGEIYDQDGSRGIYVPDNAISDATKEAGGNTVAGTQTGLTTQRTGSLVQSGINGMNSGINAMKNAVQKKATENKVSISANYKVTIREKKN